MTDAGAVPASSTRFGLDFLIETPFVAFERIRFGFCRADEQIRKRCYNDGRYFLSGWDLWSQWVFWDFLWKRHCKKKSARKQLPA